MHTGDELFEVEATVMVHVKERKESRSQRQMREALKAEALESPKRFMELLLVQCVDMSVIATCRQYSRPSVSVRV
jgi:hypothetical protein